MVLEGCGKSYFAQLLAGRIGARLYVCDLRDVATLGINDDNFPDFVQRRVPLSHSLILSLSLSLSLSLARAQINPACHSDCDMATM
jgi:hypothetical protein